jgi:hypothetical protein
MPEGPLGTVSPPSSEGSGRVLWILSRRLATHEEGYRLLEAAQWAASFFGELSGRTVRLRSLLPNSRVDGLALPWMKPPVVALRNQRSLPRMMYTAAHELTHLLQRPYGPLPGGERACDLFTLARVGRCILAPPRYLRIPPETRSEWPQCAEVAWELAGEAIRKRREGRRQYIRWWEERFGQWARPSPVPVPPARVPKGTRPTPGGTREPPRPT